MRLDSVTEGGLAYRSNQVEPDQIRLDRIQTASVMEIAGRRACKENIGEIPIIMEDNQMISTNESKVTILTPWMEVIGPFVELVVQDGVLLAEIAKHIVVLPLELKDGLTPHLGHRITILRTDIQGKEYLIRILADDKQDLPTLEDTSRNTVNLCKNGHLPNRCEVIG